MCDCCSIQAADRNADPVADPDASRVGASAVIYTVEGMTCGSCASKVTAAVDAVDGVTSAIVDLPAGTVTVTGPAVVEAVTSAISKAGYTAAPRAGASHGASATDSPNNSPSATVG